MLAVKETEHFKRVSASVWGDEERDGFIDWIASNPMAGDAIPGTTGLRKVRWGRVRRSGDLFLGLTQKCRFYSFPPLGEGRDGGLGLRLLDDNSA